MKTYIAVFTEATMDPENPSHTQVFAGIYKSNVVTWALRQERKTKETELSPPCHWVVYEADTSQLPAVFDMDTPVITAGAWMQPDADDGDILF